MCHPTAWTNDIMCYVLRSDIPINDAFTIVSEIEILYSILYIIACTPFNPFMILTWYMIFHKLLCCCASDWDVFSQTTGIVDFGRTKLDKHSTRTFTINYQRSNVCGFKDQDQKKASKSISLQSILLHDQRTMIWDLLFGHWPDFVFKVDFSGNE